MRTRGRYSGKLIPEDFLVKPAVSPRTPAEQVALASIEGVPAERAHFLKRNVALSMPDLPWSRNWLQHVEGLGARGLRAAAPTDAEIPASFSSSIVSSSQERSPGRATAF